MTELSTRLIAPEEFTCFEGLKLLEKLLVSGQLVPALEIKSYLPKKMCLELVQALLVAKIVKLENAYKFLEESCSHIQLFNDYDYNGGVGYWFLRKAVEVNCPKRVSYLLTLHKTVQLFRQRDMVLATRLAAKHGNVECLRLLLNERSFETKPSGSKRMRESGVDNDDLSKNHAKTFDNELLISPLYVAASNGKAECIQLLLDFGFHVDGPTKCNTTPLFLACEHGHLEAIKVLIEAGANVNKISLHRMKMLPGMLSVMIYAGENVAEDFNVHYRRNLGWTPLHMAATLGLAEVAIMLIEYGADLEARDFRGWTPLYCAVKKSREALVRVLIAAGADLSVKARDGKALEELAETDDIRALLHK